MQDPIAIVPPEKIGKNKFVVWNNATRTFEEFSIKIADKQNGKNYIDLSRRPPVIRSGFLAYEKNIYQLSIHDVLRGHFNATRPYHRPATTDLITAPVGNIPTNNSNKSRPEKSLGTSFDEAANLYFEEQIELLFNIEDT